MATISANVRWSDNTETLKQNIVKGITVVDELKKSVDRTAYAMGGEGLFKATNKMVLAIEQAGGVIRMTTGEQERYNAMLTKAIEKANVMGEAVPDQWRKLKGELDQHPPLMERVASTWGKIKEQVGATMLGFVSAQAIMGALRMAWHSFVGFVKDSVTAWTEQEDATQKLTTALQTQGRYTPELAKQYEDLGGQFQNTTIYADELIQNMEALLIQVGNVAPSAMKGALTAATDLASGLGVDLNTATMLVAKAFAGETGTLSRYGIIIDDTAKKTKGAAQATVDAIEAAFGGQAQAKASTFSGQIAQINNAWGDFKEVVGKMLTGVLLPMLPALKEAAIWMQGLGKVVEWARLVFDAFLVAGLSTIKFLIDAEIRILKMTNAFGVNNAKIAELKAASDGYATAIKGVVEKQDAVTVATVAGTNAMKQRVSVDKDAAAAAKKSSAEMAAQAEAAEKLTLKLRDPDLFIGPAVPQRIQEANDKLDNLIATIEAEMHPAALKFNDLAFAIENVGAKAKTSDLATRQLVTGVVGLAPAAKDATRETRTLGDTFKSALGNVDTILSNISGKFAEVTSVAVRTGRAIMENFAKGDWIGMIIAGIAGAVSAIKTLFGGLSADVKKARADVAEYEKSFGGVQNMIAAVSLAFAETGRSGADAELALKNLWNSSQQGAEATKRAIDELNAVLNEQKQDAADLKAAIAEYGFTIEQLGPAMQKQQLTEQAVTLMNQFRLLAGSGIDVGLVVEKMSGKLNDYLNLSIKTGTEVPESMRPIIQKMIEMGTWTDANGVKITDLSATGLTFSETMTQGFDRIVQKLEEVINKIAGASGAINAIPTHKTIQVDFEMGPVPEFNYDNYAARGGFVTSAGVQYLQGGGNVLPFHPRGSDTVRAMLTPGEGVVNRSGMSALGADGLRRLNRGEAPAPVIDFSAMAAELRQLREEQRAMRRDLSRSFPRAMFLAARDGNAQSRGRR